VQFRVVNEEGKVKLEDGTSKKADPKAIEAFRMSLTKLGDVYVNDAFGTAHRAHSSIVGVALKEKAAGFLMEAELNAFSKVLESPQRPLLAILGGAKIADKIPLINNLLERANEHRGGGMAFTFRRAGGCRLATTSLIGGAKIARLFAKAKQGCAHPLPVDFDRRQVRPNETRWSAKEGVPTGWMGLDAGPKSIELYSRGNSSGEYDCVESVRGVRIRKVCRLHKAMANRSPAAGAAQRRSSGAAIPRRRPRVQVADRSRLLHWRRVSLNFSRARRCRALFSETLR
jgi:phosphoglycerate kinase